MQILRKSLFLAGAALISVATLPLQAQVHNISTATNLFTPSFRTGDNSGNTTWFGWTYGGFIPSGVVSGKEVLDQDAGGPNSVGNATSFFDIAPHIGQAPSTIGTTDVISMSRGLYQTSGTTVPITLTVPMNVAESNLGLGYTTIIIQGHTTTNPYDLTPTGAAASFSFDSVNGTSPTQFLVGTNASAGGPPAGTIGKGQFWVKYEIAGSAESYDITFNLSSSFSISGLQVDTVWSPTGFAPDIAVVPEPSSALLMACGGVALTFFRRRTKRA